MCASNFAFISHLSFSDPTELPVLCSQFNIPKSYARIDDCGADSEEAYISHYSTKGVSRAQARAELTLALEEEDSRFEDEFDWAVSESMEGAGLPGNSKLAVGKQQKGMRSMVMNEGTASSVVIKVRRESDDKLACGTFKRNNYERPTRRRTTTESSVR